MSALVSSSSADRLYEFVKGLGVQNLTDPKGYHATVLYSRKGVPHADKQFVPFPIRAHVKKWTQFDMRTTGKKCLVAELDCPALEALHKHMITTYGATHDFPEYKPHVTVSYDCHDLPTNIPSFEIIFDQKEFKGLDPTFVPK